MFWGCISIFGTGCLIPVNGTLRSDSYCDIIENHLRPYAQACYGESAGILQQDNARCHTSKIARQYFAQAGIEVLPWSASSPDMNPIENIWACLKRKVYADDSGETRQAVIDKATNIWENDDDLREACINAIMSMPDS